MILKGTTVRQKVPTIEGVVDNAVLDADTGLISYHVQFKDAAGEASARWFSEKELEIPEQQPAQTTTPGAAA